MGHYWLVPGTAQTTTLSFIAINQVFRFLLEMYINIFCFMCFLLGTILNQAQRCCEAVDRFPLPIIPKNEQLRVYRRFKLPQQNLFFLYFVAYKKRILILFWLQVLDSLHWYCLIYVQSVCLSVSVFCILCSERLFLFNVCLRSFVCVCTEWWD